MSLIRLFFTAGIFLLILHAYGWSLSLSITSSMHVCDRKLVFAYSQKWIRKMTKSLDLLKTKDALVYGLCQFFFPAITPVFSTDKDAVELNVGGALRRTKGSIPGVKRKLTSGMLPQA